MVTATNIEATAVNTIAWLSDPATAIVVPVYQRQYRWDIGGCEQLLADIRAVAATADDQMHFIGSILSSEDADGGSPELVLIDGQQRVTTLMLLVAALRHTAASDAPELVRELDRVLLRSQSPKRTKLRPHRAWAEVFEGVVLDARGESIGEADSRFDSNYAFFRSQIRPDEVHQLWRGLQKLEHVAITLGAHAHAQQIFESLNSTGEPLRDHELIHNYVLMGLSHDEQILIEDTYWLPIEQYTADAIGTFWRHYLVMRTGREVQVDGGRGVYDTFRQEFPLLDSQSLAQNATQWREFAQIYQTLLQPATASDPRIGQHLVFLNTFGRAVYPLTMRALYEHSQGMLDADDVVRVLENLQSVLLRRTICGLDTDRLVARLCRAWDDGPAALARAMGRITPSDERVRVALKFSALPHPSYVLGRLLDVSDAAAFELDHVFPLAPADGWSGDGTLTWRELSDDAQNSHRALAPTLGNLALLEPELADRARDLSFSEKQASAYQRSGVPGTQSLADLASWGTAAISARTALLSDRFVAIWAHPAKVGIDDDGLTPVLDALRRRGWPRGWQREFEYVEYRGEHWEVYDVKYLFNRTFKRLWADSRDAVVSYSERRGGPVYPTPAWTGQWDQLDESSHLYMGWDSKYMLTAVQGVLDEAGIAAEVFVKYSYIGKLM